MHMVYDLPYFLCLFIVFYKIGPLLYFVHAPPLAQGGGWIWSRLLERTPVEGDQAGGGATSLRIAMVASREPVTCFSPSGHYNRNG
jgi:hypothetical protein